MKLQLIDNDGILVEEKVFKANDSDTLFMKYDSFNGLEITVLKDEIEVKDDYVPNTNAFKSLKEYMETITKRYVQEYMHKYEEADTDLADYKEVK